MSTVSVLLDLRKDNISASVKGDGDLMANSAHNESRMVKSDMQYSQFSASQKKVTKMNLLAPESNFGEPGIILKQIESSKNPSAEPVVDIELKKEKIKE